MNVTRWLPMVLTTMLVGCAQSSKSPEYNMQIEASEAASYEAKSAISEEMPENGGNRFDEFSDNPFVDVAKQPVSTFSIDADGASYAIMRRYVSEDVKIPSESVRIEEFLNYFTFDYPSPTGDNTVGINAEVGECPWNPEHKLLRLGVKGKNLKSEEIPQANFVFSRPPL